MEFIYLCWDSIVQCVQGFFARIAIGYIGLPSQNLHLRLVDSILRSPMEFFDRTPTGRIISRPSGDTDIIGLHFFLILLYFFLIFAVFSYCCCIFLLLLHFLIFCCIALFLFSVSEITSITHFFLVYFYVLFCLFFVVFLDNR